ncbi:hypothetical protein ATANTOWER_024620 [Ataeniobius toweri]|uniref:Uncharacterized protein n=1 Tax=Ataeniobius toweri TaxID=208326 RepID=A0ABU7A9X5_9TELE|nr:hypothetical protein [Ataeniobius toweri]
MTLRNHSAMLIQSNVCPGKVDRLQRLSEVMPDGDAEWLWLLLLLHLRPKLEPSLKSEVKELTGSKGHMFLSHQSFQTSSPSFQHLDAYGGRTVSWTPEDLRSQNLKSTEV